MAHFVIKYGVETSSSETKCMNGIDCYIKIFGNNLSFKWLIYIPDIYFLPTVLFQINTQ